VTRDACERWVKARKCRPESSCYDGCNWGTCDETGSGTWITDLACPRSLDIKEADGSARSVVFLFEKGSKELPAGSSWDGIVTAINEALRSKRRSAYVLGESMADDAETPQAREQLALARAEQVRMALVERGIDPTRLRALASPHQSDRRRASIHLLPQGKLKEELDPASDEYKSYCADP
jgi:hypothetical protein